MSSKDQWASLDIDELLDSSNSEDNDNVNYGERYSQDYESEGTIGDERNRKRSRKPTTIKEPMECVTMELDKLDPLLDQLEISVDPDNLASSTTSSDTLEIVEEILPDEEQYKTISSNETPHLNPHSIRKKKKHDAPVVGVKKSLENLVKNVNTARKQLSLTNFRKKKRDPNILGMGDNFSTMDIQKLPKTYPNRLKRTSSNIVSPSETSSTIVIPFTCKPELSDINKFVEKLGKKQEMNDHHKMTSLLDQSSSGEISSKKPEVQPLVIAVEEEVRVQKIENSKEWQKAMICRETTGPKDFRRIFVYISGKIEMPGKKIFCLGYSPRNNTLLIGGEGGLLKILEVEQSPSFIRTDNPDVQDVAYKVLRHETLKGHIFDVKHLTWHNSGDRFTTSDVHGVIIGWLNYNGTWIPELVQDRNSSTVLGIYWSPQSSHVCFTFKETGSDKYGIVTGLLDGSREWSLDLGKYRPSPIVWLEDCKIAAIYNNAISIHSHTNGQKLQKRSLPHGLDGKNGSKIDLEDDDVVAFLTKQDSTWTVAGTISFAIIWEKNRMMLLRNIDDPNVIAVRTRLNATCASWSPNGLFIAVGGLDVASDDNISQVNIFSYVGKLLTMINISEAHLSSVTWDMNSLHLSIGANNLLFFGKVRPMYKFASNGTLVAYAYTMNKDNLIAFWNGRKLSTIKVPGKVVDLRNHDELFTVLSVSDLGIYNASILNSTGLPVDTFCVLGMEPFEICLTDSCVICLSDNSFVLWRYKCYEFNVDIGTTKRTQKHCRHVHIDENSPMIPPIREGIEGFSKVVSDPAVCMDARLQCLCIARASGKLQFYNLPQGGMLRTLEVENFSPYLMTFNPLGDRLALLDMNGSLSFATVEDSMIEIKKSKATKEVLNLMWAKDMEYHLCVMERTKMYILRNGKIEEIFNYINVLEGYLAGFENLQITLLKLDDILDNPEEQISSDQIWRVDMQIVEKMKQELQDGDESKLQSIFEKVKKRNHPVLWGILSDEALKFGNFDMAEIGFVKGKNYSGLQFLKKIRGISNLNLRQAEIYSFTEDYDKAEKCYITANRKYEAVEMWKHLGEFLKANTITIWINAFGGGDQHPTEFKKYELATMAENYIQNEDIEAAVECYKKSKDYERVLDCYVMLEDYEGLLEFYKTVPKTHPVVENIAGTFAAVGMTLEAVDAHLSNDDPQTAVAIALENFQWNLALELSEAHGIPIVEPVLLNYTGKLIEIGDIMQAVQLLHRSDKTFAAGKLLIKVGLLELEQDKPYLESVKKLFVMAALALTAQPKKFLKVRKLCPSSVNIENGEDVDLKFDKCIPEEYQPTPDELKWMRESPWRAAHAVHYLIIVQMQIYHGHFEKATKAANHLKNYCDILGDERVHSMIAFASAKGQNYYICSKALYQLESLSDNDEFYNDIAPELLGDMMTLSDKRTRSIICPKCTYKLPDYHATCEDCGFAFPVCIKTGNILTETEYVWTCTTCGGTADSRKIKRVKYCPLCHTQKCSIRD